MAAPTIPNGEEHFFPIIYEGNGGGQRVGRFVPFTDNGTIANSLIFNDGDSAYLSRTPSGTGNRRTFTFSGWVKRGVFDTSNGNDLFNAGTNPGNNVDQLLFDSSNRLRFYSYGGSYLFQYISNRTFEDTSKWYHIVCAVDTTQSSASDRVKIYVDGDLITSFSTETDPALNGECFHFNNTSTHYIGANVGSQRFYDGYIAEYNFVDGQQLTPDTFGLTDTSTGRWIPKALTGITYGTNGFRLQFGSPSALGDDTSGNNNDFSVTNLVAGDQTTDSPTQNFPTIDSNRSSLTLSEGNTVGQGSPTVKFAFSGMTFDPSDTTGYYLEFKVLSASGGVIGFRSDTDPLPISTTASYLNDGYLAMNFANDLYLDGTSIYNGSGTWTTNDIIGFYIKENKLYYSVNGTMQNSSNHVGVFSKPGRYRITMGHNSSSGAASFQMFCPQSKWTYTPSGDFANYREINQDNAPETAKGIVGLTWIKDRDNAYSHGLRDSSRGRHKDIFSNLTQDEVTNTDGVQKFLKGGIQIEDLTGLNASGASIVAWNWVANSGTTASKDDGSITSVVQANQTAGFSIVQWTGLGGGTGRTIGHGLSSAPEWIVVKNLTGSSSYNWNVYHIGTDASNPSDYFVSLNTTNARDNSANLWNDTAPTSTVFSVNHEATAGASGNKMIAYCWHEIPGFSKFGSYIGNGSTDGTFVYLGFRPSFIMLKSSSNAISWYMFDSKRDPINPAGKRLVADGTFVEDAGTTEALDFVSNGFKLRNSSVGTNGSGYTMLYMAFAEHPFVGDGTNPVTAR